MIIKGNLHTDELMQAVIAKPTLHTERRMSHVFVLFAPQYHKPLFLTDVAINIDPDLLAKKDIIQNAIDLFRCVHSGQVPKVAILSAVETVTQKLPSTLDATALCKMAERGQIRGGVLDGPLAFDNAISKKAAELKSINSEVAGDADILVVPNIEAGNILYKQMRFLSNIQGIGIVLGAKIPIVLTSRAEDNLISRKASCLLSLCYIHHKSFLLPPFKMGEIYN